jgi:hypothetical protein
MFSQNYFCLIAHSFVAKRVVKTRYYCSKMTAKDVNAQQLKRQIYVARINHFQNALTNIILNFSRSLICLGLNEQALHLWLEALASNEEVVKRYYQPWSFIGSPGTNLYLLRYSFGLQAT